MIHTDEVISFEEMKQRYPGEWLVIGEPVFDGLRLVTGIVIAHDKDKREVALKGRDLVKGFQEFTL